MAMIQFAIESKGAMRKMTLKEIYDYIETKFPYFKVNLSLAFGQLHDQVEKKFRNLRNTSYSQLQVTLSAAEIQHTLVSHLTLLLLRFKLFHTSFLDV